MKTTRLDTTLVTPTWRPARRHWYDLPVPLAAAILIVCLLGIAMLSARVRSGHQASAVPTPGLVILIATAQSITVPTAVPQVQQAAVVHENVTQRPIGVFGGPDPATYIGSVEQGRSFVPIGRYGSEWIQVDMSGSGRVFVRSSDLYGVPELVDLKPAPAPIVVNQPIYVSVPSYAVPTPAPEEYAVANQPPASDFYSPPDTSIEARQALIGSDPNALACGGSPMCGGMTNQQAQDAIDREKAIQGHYANEHQP